MSQQLQKIEQFGGMMQFNGDTATPKTYNFAWNMKNCTINNGFVERSKSYKSISLSGATPTGKSTGKYKAQLVGYDIILEGYGTSIYKRVDDVLTLLYTGVSTNGFLDFTICYDAIIICNGIDKPLKYESGSITEMTMTDPDSIWNDARPISSFVFANRLFYVTADGKLLSPQPLSFNNFDNSLNTVAGIQMASGEASQIIGAMPYISDLVAIYTHNSILKLSGSMPAESTSVVDPFVIRPLNLSLGCVSKRTIIPVGLDQYFLSAKGFRSLNAIQGFGDVNTTDLFETIKNDYSSLKLKSKIGESLAVFDDYNDKIRLFVQTYGDQTVEYGIDIKNGNIEKSILPFVVTSAMYDDYDQSIYISDEDGNHYSNKQTYYDSSESYYELMFYPSKYGKGILKKWDRLILDVETDTVLSNFKVQTKHYLDDGQQSSFTSSDNQTVSGSGYDNAEWDVDSWDSQSGGLITIKNIKKSKALKIRFYNTTSGEHYRVKSLELLYTPLGQRKI